MRERVLGISGECRAETLTISVGEIFHKVERLNSILDDIEKKINGDIPMKDECKQSEPQGIRSYVHFSEQSLDAAITLAERIKDIL